MTVSLLTFVQARAATTGAAIGIGAHAGEVLVLITDNAGHRSLQLHTPADAREAARALFDAADAAELHAQRSATDVAAGLADDLAAQAAEAVGRG